MPKWKLESLHCDDMADNRMTAMYSDGTRKAKVKVGYPLPTSSVTDEQLLDMILKQSKPEPISDTRPTATPPTDRFRVQLVIRHIQGYYQPRPGEDASTAFVRALNETTKNLT